jgi:hypothetical protein
MKAETKPVPTGEDAGNPDRPISANRRGTPVSRGRKPHLTDPRPKPPYVITMEGAYLPIQEYDARRGDILVHAEASA